ncbi:hypothetical protein K503DRAFT_780347 [Rhizopogon vinicolor AM-OR11-026]|uniref:Uncharacterized protein n=1 Tax=Rhizopogon vinicolor AM-OR11-026 TaxID=1314800 RepID=A0A1B7NAL8_9AGAM|nr:hypothetical protein K503DRAFT_780347 [Rhizopogon vinicolor AM-OR11-026]
MPPKSFVNSPPSSPTAHHTVPKKSGMRMLNGRVYGSKRNNSINANPFANVRDEPEFVEWGYGGMGSVKGSSDSKYSVLATGTPALLSHTQTQKVVIGGGRGAVGRVSVETVARAVEDDDGSGMGWVRKRREERERLAREKEDQARHTSAEARHSGEINRSSFDSPTLDTDSRCTSTDGSSALDTDLSTLAASSAPTTPPSTTDTLPEDEQEKHITQAVRLSPKHTRHHLSHLRQLGAHSPETQDLVVGTTIGRLESDKNDQSPTSEISSDTDGEDDTLKDDDESEIEQTEDQRKTSLGAGVEKISRHKELVHKDSDR